MSTCKNDPNSDFNSDSDSSECSNKFWTRQHLDVQESSEERLAPLSPNAEVEGTSKRRQTKMLLVSLIESFCRVHGDSPEANRRVFFLICQTLSSLGFIDAEFVDEMASVRTTFQSAFQKLFYTAVETVRSTEFRLDQSRMIQDSHDNGYDYDYNSFDRSCEHSCRDLESTPPDSCNGGFNLNVQNSRYRNDFVEVSLLGRGGFASVYRARNKLDGIEYAVKRIRLGPDLVDSSSEDGGHRMSPYDKIFREIKHLARLEHRNVVRYYASWLEYTDESPTPPLYQQDEKIFEDDEHSIFNGRDPTFDDDDLDNQQSLDMSHIIFGEGNAAQSPEDEQEEEAGSCKDDTSMCILDKDHRSHRRRQSKRRVSMKSSRDRRKSSTLGWTLYIQMYLCPATLHDFIQHRNQNAEPVDPTRNIEIFQGILEGAAYIHAQGLIHRDLKPSNIFLAMPENNGHRSRHWRSQSNDNHGFSFGSVTNMDGTLRDCMWEEKWVPKIGDFGLAAPAIRSPPPPTPECSISPATIGPRHGFPTLSSPFGGRASDESSNRGQVLLSALMTCRQQPSSGVGTRTYAAPEQLEDPPRMYDNKVDIYSLGIILFELYQPFSTAMERACAIDQLRHGVFPDGFVEKYPKVSALILWAMDTNPSHRPSAYQLLEFELFSSPEEDMFCQLQAKVEAQSAALDTKNREMEALRDKMKQLELNSKREMDAMQRRVDELQQKLNESATTAATT
ncbi:kinase-like domain-containing protein [Dichotomocladium elegans]|nr:kinase-like domain-containing protein [Dichotomocladium elegans]